MQPTGQPLDFACRGTGFFAVRTANGVQYTRNGQFSVSNRGILVDQYGNDVLSQNGSPIPVGASGTVPTTALGLFNVNNPSQLGNNNFSGKAAAGRAAGQSLLRPARGIRDRRDPGDGQDGGVVERLHGRSADDRDDQPDDAGKREQRRSGALMLEGLYSAGAGMETAQNQLDAVSNNIANEDTPGYQSELLGFHDLLYTTDNDDPSSAIVGAGSGTDTIGYSQTQGSLQQTGNPLDVAINGPGYFQVRQPDGTTGLDPQRHICS